MTSLHYTLIALGIGLVGVVMLYNIFQEQRSRKQAERLFQMRDNTGEDPSLSDLPHPDNLSEARIDPRIHILHDDAPAEVPAEVPTLSQTSLAQQAEAAPASAVESPASAVESSQPDSARSAAPTMTPESPLDSEIEYIARLRYAEPSTIPFIALQENLRRISKPIRMVGRREDGGWEPVLGRAARPYDTVELSLLLADRSGPVTEVQLDAFCKRLYEFATEHGGAISCQDKAEAVAKAKALDAFCAEVDMLIGLNLLPPADAGFESQQLGDLALRAGLVPTADGGYAMKDERGQIMFALTDGAPGTGQSAQGVALLFDVPRVARGLESFDRMNALALDLAERLGGHLVDDGGRGVNRASLQKDRKALEAIYARMTARGIPAGGDRALRLFA